MKSLSLTMALLTMILIFFIAYEIIKKIQKSDERKIIKSRYPNYKNGLTTSMELDKYRIMTYGSSVAKVQLLTNKEPSELFNSMIQQLNPNSPNPYIISVSAQSVYGHSDNSFMNLYINNGELEKVGWGLIKRF